MPDAQRERLIELLDKPCTEYRFGSLENTDKIADYLLANGVIVPPVKVGQKVWVRPAYSLDICEGVVTMLVYNRFTKPQEWIRYTYTGPYSTSCELTNRIDLCLGKTVFLTPEAAEAYIKEARGNMNAWKES